MYVNLACSAQADRSAGGQRRSRWRQRARELTGQLDWDDYDTSDEEDASEFVREETSKKLAVAA